MTMDEQLDLEIKRLSRSCYKKLFQLMERIPDVARTVKEHPCSLNSLGEFQGEFSMLESQIASLATLAQFREDTKTSRKLST